MGVDGIGFMDKGSRARQINGFPAALLRICLILPLNYRQVGRRASIQKLLGLANSYVPVGFIRAAHIHCVEEAQQVVSVLIQTTGFKDLIPLVETGMVLATHGGPGTLGIRVVAKNLV